MGALDGVRALLDRLRVALFSRPEFAVARHQLGAGGGEQMIVLKFTARVEIVDQRPKACDPDARA